MTDRELMQQALVALEYAADEIGCPNDDDSIGIARKALRARLAGWERVNMHDHKEGDLGIGTVKWDASAPLVVHPCTPRGQWIAHVRCGCGDQIMPDDGAECGNCVTARNAVKSEWQGLTEEEIKHLWYEACQTNLELTSQLVVHLARNVEAKLKEKNND